MKIKVAYIISNIDKALAFEWIATSINQDKFELLFILLNPGKSELEKFLIEKGIQVINLRYRGKIDLIPVFFRLRKILKREKCVLVHTHLFDASLVGLLAARSLGIKKRIYTRHYATFHHRYFPRAVYYDRLINGLATHLVAISENVRSVLIQKEFVHPDKVNLIHHGFQLEVFSETNPECIVELQKKYTTTDKFPVIGVISRQTHLKGIQHIIPVFKRLLTDYPNACLVLANAVGDYKREIDTLLLDIPPASYRQVQFEKDLAHFYHIFTVYIHTPIDAEVEAFGQTYVEALAAGIPSVFTLSGVASEFIENEKNALVVPFENPEAIYQAIKRLLSDEVLREQLTRQGKKDVKELFNLRKMIQSLENLYVS